MRGMKQFICFCLHFWVTFWTVGKKNIAKKGLLRSRYWHNRKAPCFIAYRTLSVLYGFLVHIGDIIVQILVSGLVIRLFLHTSTPL